MIHARENLPSDVELLQIDNVRAYEIHATSVSTLHKVTGKLEDIRCAVLWKCETLFSNIYLRDFSHHYFEAGVHSLRHPHPVVTQAAVSEQRKVPSLWVWYCYTFRVFSAVGQKVKGEVLQEASVVTVFKSAAIF